MPTPDPDPQPNPEPRWKGVDYPKDSFDDGKAKPIPPPVKEKPKTLDDPFGMLHVPNTLQPARFSSANPFGLTTQMRPIAAAPIRPRKEVLREMETLMEEMQREMAALRENIESVRSVLAEREVNRTQTR